MKIEFSDIARSAFAFLLDNGFTLAKTTGDQVTYESSDIFVRIDWDVRSGELDVHIGLRQEQNVPGGNYSLSDLLEMVGADEPNNAKPFQVDKSRLGSFLDRLSSQLRTYGQPAIVGEHRFYERLREFTSTKARNLTRGMDLSRIRASAEDAWQRRAYDAVVSLYISIAEDLTEIERKRLELATKRSEG